LGEFEIENLSEKENIANGMRQDMCTTKHLFLGDQHCI